MEIQTVSFKNENLKMSSAKRWPYFFSLYVLMDIQIGPSISFSVA